MRLILRTLLRSVICMPRRVAARGCKCSPAHRGRDSSSLDTPTRFLTRIDAVFSTAVGPSGLVPICPNMGDRPIYLRVSLKLTPATYRAIIEIPPNNTVLRYQAALLGVPNCRRGGRADPQIEAY